MPFHIKALKGVLSKQVPNSITDIIEEIQVAFDDEMDVGEGKISPLVRLMSDWTPVIPFRKAQKIIARTSSRMFVGLPLCNESLEENAHARSQRRVSPSCRYAYNKVYNRWSPTPVCARTSESVRSTTFMFIAQFCCALI
jgi:hypothetical protein